MKDSIISAEGLTIGYDGKPLYSDFSFDIGEGDYCFVIGDNGTGKTSLMKTILGLVKPLGGRIEIADGTEGKDIGYMPQQTGVQRDFPASVKEIVLTGFAGKNGLKPFYSRKQRELARTNLDKLGILNLENRCYRELSGGQQQRVLLARTLCAASKIMLLDEPVAGLDPDATEELYELIAKLNREGMTIIMISHDIPAARKYATSVIHIADKPEFSDAKSYFRAKEEK